jgi:hypothetical protein
LISLTRYPNNGNESHPLIQRVMLGFLYIKIIPQILVDMI